MNPKLWSGALVYMQYKASATSVLSIRKNQIAMNQDQAELFI